MSETEMAKKTAHDRRMEKIRVTFCLEPTDWEIWASRMFPLPPADQPYLTTPEGVKMKCPVKARRLLSRCEWDDDITGLHEAGTLIKVLFEEPAAATPTSSLAPPRCYYTPGRPGTFSASSINPNGPFAQSPCRIQTVSASNANHVSPSSSYVQENSLEGWRGPAEQNVTLSPSNHLVTTPLRNPPSFHFGVILTRPNHDSDHEGPDRTLSAPQSDSPALTLATKHIYSPQSLSFDSSPTRRGRPTRLLNSKDYEATRLEYEAQGSPTDQVKDGKRKKSGAITLRSAKRPKQQAEYSPLARPGDTAYFMEHYSYLTQELDKNPAVKSQPQYLTPQAYAVSTRSAPQNGYALLPGIYHNPNVASPPRVRATSLSNLRNDNISNSNCNQAQPQSSPSAVTPSHSFSNSGPRPISEAECRDLVSKQTEFRRLPATNGNPFIDRGNLYSSVPQLPGSAASDGITGSGYTRAQYALNEASRSKVQTRSYTMEDDISPFDPDTVMVTPTQRATRASKACDRCHKSKRRCHVFGITGGGCVRCKYMGSSCSLLDDALPASAEFSPQKSSTSSCMPVSEKTTTGIKNGMKHPVTKLIESPQTSMYAQQKQQQEEQKHAMQQRSQSVHNMNSINDYSSGLPNLELSRQLSQTHAMQSQYYLPPPGFSAETLGYAAARNASLSSYPQYQMPKAYPRTNLNIRIPARPSRLLNGASPQSFSTQYDFQSQEMYSHELPPPVPSLYPNNTLNHHDPFTISTMPSHSNSPTYLQLPRIQYIQQWQESGHGALLPPTGLNPVSTLHFPRPKLPVSSFAHFFDSPELEAKWCLDTEIAVLGADKNSTPQRTQKGHQPKCTASPPPPRPSFQLVPTYVAPRPGLVVPSLAEFCDNPEQEIKWRRDAEAAVLVIENRHQSQQLHCTQQPLQSAYNDGPLRAGLTEQYMYHLSNRK